MNSFWLIYSIILRNYGHVIWPARGTQFDLPLQIKVLFGTFFPSGHTNVGTFPFLHLTLHFFVVQFTSTAASGTSNCSKTVVSHFVTYDDFKINSQKYRKHFLFGKIFEINLVSRQLQLEHLQFQKQSSYQVHKMP